MYEKRLLYLGLDPARFARKAQARHYPVIRIEGCSHRDPCWLKALEHMDRYSHLVISSRSAVPLLCELLTPPQLQQLQSQCHCVAIGDGSARCLEDHGFHVHRVAALATAEGLADTLKSLDLSRAHVFWPHSAQSRPVLSRFFRDHGICFEDCPLYRPVFQCLSPIPPLEEFREIVFTSPSTVEAFLAIYSTFPEHAMLTAIGPITRSCLIDKGAPEPSVKLEA